MKRLIVFFVLVLSLLSESTCASEKEPFVNKHEKYSLPLTVGDSVVPLEISNLEVVVPFAKQHNPGQWTYVMQTTIYKDPETGKFDISQPVGTEMFLMTVKEDISIFSIAWFPKTSEAKIEEVFKDSENVFIQTALGTDKFSAVGKTIKRKVNGQPAFGQKYEAMNDLGKKTFFSYYLVEAVEYKRYYVLLFVSTKNHDGPYEAFNKVLNGIKFMK